MDDDRQKHVDEIIQPYHNAVSQAVLAEVLRLKQPVEKVEFALLIVDEKKNPKYCGISIMFKEDIFAMKEVQDSKPYCYLEMLPKLNEIIGDRKVYHVDFSKLAKK